MTPEASFEYSLNGEVRILASHRFIFFHNPKEKKEFLKKLERTMGKSNRVSRRNTAWSEREELREVFGQRSGRASGPKGVEFTPTRESATRG